MKTIIRSSGSIAILLAFIGFSSCQKSADSLADADISSGTISSNDEVDAKEVIADFEKQPFSQQWDELACKDMSQQFLIGNRSQIPVRQGNYAARFIVRPGDAQPGTSGERCEVGHYKGFPHGYTQEKPDDDFYYGWSTYVPSDWRTPSGWCIIAQWHARAATLPPIAVYIDENNNFGMNFYTGLVTMPATWYKNYAFTGSFPMVRNLTKNAWHDFMVRIRFTPNKTGLVQVWHKMQWEKNWVQVLSKINIPTMQLIRNQDWPALDSDNYPQLPDNRIPWGPSHVTTQTWARIGLYRGANSFTNVIYHDNWARARWWSAITNNFQ